MRSARRIGLYAVILGLALGLGATLAAQADPFMGTWVLNAEKSEFNTTGAGARARTITIAAKADKISHMQDTFRVGQDAVQRLTYEAKYDGKDYGPVIGGAFDMVSFTRTGTTLVRKAKNMGKEVETATYTLSPDGKTMTVVTTGNNYGVEYGSTQVFEKKAAGTN